MDQLSKHPVWHIDAAGLVTCVIVTVLAYGFVVAPLLKRQGVVAAEYQQLADRQKEASRLSNTLLALRSRCNTIEGQSTLSQIKLWSTDQMNGRLAELTGLLDRCAMEVDTLKAGTPIPGSFCDLVTIRVSGQGGYRECRAFLRDLHRTMRDIHAIGFDLKANPAKPEAGGQFRLDLFWYAARRPQTS